MAGSAMERWNHVEGGTLDLTDHPALTYRKIDYWLRTGMLAIPELVGLGSGARRRFTPAQQAAIRDVADRVDELDAAWRELQSGDYFRARLAHHESTT